MSTVQLTPREVFTYSLELPSGRSRILLTIIGWMILFFPLLLVPYVTAAAAAILATTLWLVSIGIGRVWAWMSRKLVDFLVIQPLGNYMQENKQSKRLKYFFGENPKEVFLQYEVRDLDLSGLVTFMKNSFGILVPFAAILAFIWNILESLGIEIFQALVYAFFLSFIAVGLYFPTAMVLEDARLMTISENGMIEYSASKAKNVLDGLFKVTGLVSGYSLLSGQAELNIYGSVLLVIVYVLLLIVIFVFSYPILFSSLVAYFKRHNAIVNGFRLRALELGIPIKKTAAVDITPEELEGIAIGADVEVKEVKSRRWGIIPRTVTKKIYSQEKLDSIKLHGGWVCKLCLEVGGTKSSETCQNCGKKKDELLTPNS